MGRLKEDRARRQVRPAAGPAGLVRVEATRERYIEAVSKSAKLTRKLKVSLPPAGNGAQRSSYPEDAARHRADEVIEIDHDLRYRVSRGYNPDFLRTAKCWSPWARP